MSQEVSVEALGVVLEEASKEVFKGQFTKVENFTLFLLIATSSIIILNSVKTLLAL